MPCNDPRQSCYLFAVIDLKHLSPPFSWMRAVLLRNDGESQHCYWVTVRYARRIKNVTQQCPTEDLIASKLKPVAFCFARCQCKHVCLQAFCSAGLTGRASAEDDKVEPFSDDSSLCQIIPALIEKDRFRTCPLLASLNNLLITLPVYYFTESKLKKFDCLEKLPIDLKAFVGQACAQIQKSLTLMYRISYFALMNKTWQGICNV